MIRGDAVDLPGAATNATGQRGDAVDLPGAATNATGQINVQNDAKKPINKKALVFGATVIDIGFYLNDGKMPGPDKSAQAETSITAGGKGLSQAVALSRLGIEVSLVSVIGKKYFYPVIEEVLKKEKNISVAIGDTSDELPHITGVITLDKGKSCAIGDKREGENFCLRKETIDKAFEKIKDYGFVLITYELPINTIKYILEKLADDECEHILVIVTPAPPTDKTVYYDYADEIDYLVASRWEAQKILGVDEVENQDISELATALFNKGSCVGVCMPDDGNVIIEYNNKKRISKESVSKRGAVHNNIYERDACCAALAYLLWKNGGFIEKEDLSFITAAMALSADRPKRIDSMPTLEEIEKRLRNCGESRQKS